MPSFFAALRSVFGRGTGAAAGAASPAATATLRLRAAVYSDTGPVRSSNEDRARCLVEDAGALGDRVSLVVVADGMGGHQAGEVAAETAVEVLAGVWRERAPQDAPGPLLERAIKAAGATVFESAATRPDWQGMGTTVTAIAFVGDDAIVGYVGDTRAYVHRDGVLTRLTEDDTLVNHLLKTGAIRPEQAHDHPDRGVLSQALGTRAEPPSVHVGSPFALRDRDLLLVCSDGLHDVLSDAVIARTLAEGLASGANVALAPLAESLAYAAFAAGTADNVSVALVLAGGDGPPNPSARATRVHRVPAPGRAA